MPKMKFRLKELMAEKERRTGQRVTYEVIFDATGINPSTLSRMSTNKISVSTAVIEKLCNFFDCQPGDLMIIE